MSTTSSLHSNALNFMSFIEGGVDTRTGQYTLSLKLPELGANYLQGPDLPLTLVFNPLNTVDSGWGRGWNLSLSQFTEHNQVVTTHAGESFKVTGASGNRLHMAEQKLAHFNFYRDPPGPGGNPRYRLVHRSGMVEILEVMGSLQGRIALPVEVYAPSGHSITLAYQPFNPAYMMLSRITDGLGQPLLEIERTGDRIEFRERPYAGEDGQPIARYVMNLINRDQVSSVELPTPEKASWRLEYREVLGLLCLQKIETPTGAREYLQYRDGGHLFPAASRRDPLPRVTRHIVEPSLGQPTFINDYSYPDSRNFLGFGTQISWTDDGNDNLYKHTGDYEYSCVETLRDGNERPLRTTTRTFNRFHLLSSTRTVRNACVYEVTTRYDLKDLPFDQQPPTVQLPIEEVTRWSDANDVTRNRSERVETRYDTHGNVVHRKLASGIVETSTWYSAEAQDGYPGEANGFVRHLKSKTVTPAGSDHDGAPTLTRHLRYRALPPLASADRSAVPFVVEHSDTLVDPNDAAQPLQQTLYSYIDAPGADNALLHGRCYQRLVKRNKLETVTQYRFKVLGTEPGDTPCLQTTKVSIGYDQTQSSTLEQRSLLLGEIVFERDESGVEIRREHDALRRVVRERVSPDTPYEASRHITYALCAVDGDIASQQVRNARGIHTLTELDGLGRPVGEKRDRVNDARPEMFFQISTMAYDPFGQTVEETQIDWLQGERSSTLTTRTRFDDWGEQCCVIAADGVEVHDELDPIGAPGHSGAIRRAWRESPSMPGKRQGVGTASASSARSETWLNAFGKPVLQKRLAADGESIAERRYRYDGLGRTRAESSERNHTTTFTYDAWDRMLSTLLPDGTLLTRTYAEHSDAELPASLVVKPANVQHPSRLIGTQHHDGLDRLVAATTGDRTEYFLFEGGEPQPRQRINPAGETLELDYNLQLTPEPTRSDAPEDQADFAYHATSARLLQCSNGQGVRRYEYNLANQLTAEHWDDHDSGKTWSRTHLSTLHDRLVHSTEANGVQTVHQYDAASGRLQSTRQGQLQAAFAYDALGRLASVRTEDAGTDQAVLTLLEYDDQDREIKRTWRQDGQDERTQVQIWGADDLLQRRHLQAAGVSLLDESFGYDTRARLVRHTCTGSKPPLDALGRAIAQQVFTFDAYDNISTVLTTFVGGARPERAQFIHASSDPCQLRRIEYTPARNQPNPTFKYDKNGNLVRDERSRTVRYDSQNRLLGLGPGPNQYSYDGSGALVGVMQADKPTRLLYDGLQLRMAVRDGLETLYLHQDEQPLGQQCYGTGAQAALLHTDASHSVIAQSQGGVVQGIRYTAYGERHTDGSIDTGLGFNGERLDPDSGWYLLGNGYRAYNPTLLRFNSPDALSPFAEGGLNYYGYCQGNPVTFRDPTGHYAIGHNGQSRSEEDLANNRITPRMSIGVLEWIGIGVGIAFAAAASVAAIVFTAGIATPAVSAAWTTAGGGLAGASAAVGAGFSAIGAVSFATGVKLASMIVTAALTVAGTTEQTVGVLSGSEKRINIGTILNYAGLLAGLPAALGGLRNLFARFGGSILGRSSARSAGSAFSASAGVGTSTRLSDIRQIRVIGPSDTSRLMFDYTQRLAMQNRAVISTRL